MDGIMGKNMKKRQVKHLLQSVYRLQAPTHDCRGPEIQTLVTMTLDSLDVKILD